MDLYLYAGQLSMEESFLLKGIMQSGMVHIPLFGKLFPIRSAPI